MAAKKKTKKARPPERSLRLDAVIYPKDALMKTAEAFAGIAQVAFQRKGRYWQVRLCVLKPKLADRVADEFANHALAAAVCRSIS